MNISDDMLMAYADGELDDQQRAAVDAALAQDATLEVRLEQHRALRGRLQSAYHDTLADPVPQRLTALVQAQTPVARGALLMPFKPRDGAPAVRSTAANQRWPFWGAMAASLMVGVLAGVLTQRASNRAPLELVDGSLLARGPLAQALYTQLAANQDPAAAVRMDLSYRNRAGAYCRAFSAGAASALSGVACRRGTDWQLQMLLSAPPGGAQGEYRQAGSALSGAVLTLVQSQMSGEPLDGEAEAKAAGSGWR